MTIPSIGDDPEQLDYSYIADGNEKLQTALSQALKEITELKVNGKVDLNKDTIKEMTEASSDAFKDSLKNFKGSIDKLMAAVDKMNKKS